MGASAHRLIYEGKASKVWGHCSCGQWVWLGTYVPLKGKRARLKAAHTAHVEWATV